ncbi:MAG: hypothetical protein EXS37_17410 [Opitutus sp.]|nr:hypothetical protein [Opitutus sp.]
MPPALKRLASLVAVWGVRAIAQPAVIPDAETLYPPTPSRLAAVHAAAQRDGWAPQSAMLRSAAIRAYEREKSGPAEAWLNLGRWASLWGQTEAEFVPRWAEAVQAARVGHPNMASPYEMRPRMLAANLSPDLQAWLIGSAAFSTEFFTLLSPVDFVPRGFEILNELHKKEPAKFKSYASLALAIALVYDVPPPPVWPHGQVTATALPRKFPEPAAAFAWWIKQDQQGRTFHKLTRLGAEELKFVVDTPTPLAELEWVQGISDIPLGHLARAYTMVRYRTDRITGDNPVWLGKTYKLPDILATGGICADQAYFATQVGKARGVPTLLIYGAGSNGRHAWFGFLDGNQKWQLDAGRYAEQRFVTGFARDPQTWREFSDHELQFLSERFRELPSFKQSRVHEQFAAEYLTLGNARLAGVAARKAVNFERRNQAGWETLMAAARKEGRDAKTVEALLREAALAFQRYPDLEAYYVNRVAESLRTRGETSAAEAEVRRIALKNKSGRSDLSVQQARDSVGRAIATQPLAGQIRAYNSAVDTYGRGAGIGFFDQVVAPFVQHLVQLDQRAEAGRALERARHTLKIEPGSQLQTESEKLQQQLRGK